MILGGFKHHVLEGGHKLLAEGSCVFAKRSKRLIQLKIAGCENLDAHQQTPCPVYIKVVKITWGFRGIPMFASSVSLFMFIFFTSISDV